MAISIQNISKMPAMFFLEMPSQSPSKTVLIDQSIDGLKVSIKDSDGVERQIPRYMLQGLPKMNNVPKEFFQKCYAIVSEHSIRFNGKLIGGVGQREKSRACREKAIIEQNRAHANLADNGFRQNHFKKAYNEAYNEGHIKTATRRRNDEINEKANFAKHEWNQSFLNKYGDEGWKEYNSSEEESQPCCCIIS